VSQDSEPLRILASPGVSRRIGRRSFLSGATMAALGGGLLTACGGGGSSSTTSPAATSAQPLGPPEAKLNIYTWSEYDDPDVLKQFTTSKGPKLQVDAYDSNEEMIAKLVAAKGTSGYDIIVPTGVYIPQMAVNKLVQPLNHDWLPNMANIDAPFINQPWDPGNKYTVCKDWGTTGFAYDKTKIKRQLTSWTDFLDVIQQEASGQVSVLDDPGELTGVYFWANGIDWNTTNKADLDACEDYLVKNIAPHVKAFDSYPGSTMPQGSYWLAHEWNGDARQGILGSKDPSIWQWVLPTPKTEIWMDTWAIPVGATHVNAAYAFINYILDPKVSLKELEFHGYNTGVKDIEPTARAGGVERSDMIFFTPEQEAMFTPGEINDAQQRHVDIWNKMKAAAGK
jgi:spermidine/putrescine transport system substrate-binding protein